MFDERAEIVGSQLWPVPDYVLKVVHDDSNKQVQNLKESSEGYIQ